MSSFLSDLFGGSKVDAGSKSTKLPGWVDNASKYNYLLAQRIASRPYTAYPGARISGFTGDQKDAMGMLRDYGSTAWKSGSTDFKTPRLIDNIGKGGSIDAYMNPYIDQVLDRTVDRTRQATDVAKQYQSNNTMHAAGAFGDARHGIADAEIEERGINAIKDASAQGYAGAFDNAMSMRNTDINRMYQDEDVNQRRQQQLMSYIDSLYRSGANQQGQRQKSLDMGYADFLRQQNYPIDQYNILTSALNMSPYGTQQTVQQPGPSLAGQIVGTGFNLADLFFGMGD